MAEYQRPIRRWLYLSILSWLQSRCRHPAEHVMADILEGDGNKEVKWCWVCGAVRIRGDHRWREPRADWCLENESGAVKYPRKHRDTNPVEFNHG